MKAGNRPLRIDCDADRFLTELLQMNLSLKGPAIDLWLLQVSFDSELLTRLRTVLGAEEIARANAFRFEHLQQTYTFIHGALRVLLGAYLGEEPAQLQFGKGLNGKPYLDHGRRVQFNLSHAGDVALIGFAEDCEIGVDVEKIRPITDALDIAGRFFSAEERAELMSLPESEQQRAFFRCWTRKEAYLKATGDGLGTDLASFRVSVLPFEPARLIHINGSSDAATRWSLHSVDFYPDCEAALAYAGSARDVRVLELMTVSTNKS